MPNSHKKSWTLSTDSWLLSVLFLLYRFTVQEYLNQSRGLGKLEPQEAICWLKKELCLRLDTLYTFFSNNTFLSVGQFLYPREKISSQCFLNELKFREVSQNPKSRRCWKFQFSILTNKKVLFLKKMKCTTCHDSSILNRQMSCCIATLLTYMALADISKWKKTLCFETLQPIWYQYQLMAYLVY